MDKKQMKEALKNEVAPLLIGLRSDMKKLSEDLKTETRNNIFALSDEHFKDIAKYVVVKDGVDGTNGTNGTRGLRGLRGAKGNKGDDGYSPIAGKDFWTAKEQVVFYKDILAKATPIKGIHYKDGTPGAPGKKGKDGTDITGERIIEKIREVGKRNGLQISDIFKLQDVLNSKGGGGIGGSGSTTGVSLPDQTGQNGKYLTTNGSALSWATVSSGSTDHAALSNLDYASSGHNGFQPAGSYLTSLSGALLATGATTGATSVAQAFTNGIITSSIVVPADTTTAFVIYASNGTTPIFTVDTVGGRVIISGGSSSQEGVNGSENLIMLGTNSLAFFGITPSTRASAYTQTYSTASKTVPNATVAAVSTTGSSQVTPYGYTTSAQADAIPTAINALAADVLALKKVITALIDDLQAYGLAQ
jgi:hypothetical protein